MSWVEIGYIALGIVATFIGGVIMKVFEITFNKLGRVSIHVKVTELTEVFIAMRIEIENQTNETCFIRQFTLCTVINESVIPMIPMNYTEKSDTKDKEYFADEGFYSFAIPAKSMKHYYLMFVFQKACPTNNFDKIFCQYLHGKEKIIKLSLDYKSRNWQLLKKDSKSSKRK